MGGWVFITGNTSDFDVRLSRFRRTFSVEGVPNLRIEEYVYDDIQAARSFGWAWNRASIPDVHVVRNESTMLILCGVITDLGRFGTVPSECGSTATRVLELWTAHGEEVIGQLDGSFSCLFYDSRRRQIVVFTDRFASRSVWVGEDGGTWIVGNFPSAVAAMMRNPPKIDPVGLWSLFLAGRQLGDHGLYSNVRALMAGQKAVLSPAPRKMVSKWWQRRYKPENGLSAREWGCRLADALKASAARYKKVSGSPYLFLSGGLDSRIAAASFGKTLRTLTLCTSPNAESRLAWLVSLSLGLENRRILRSPYWYLDTLDAASLISSGHFLTDHTHFIVPIQEVCSENPEAGFLLGDLLENFNKHYFKPSGGRFTFDCTGIKDFYKYVPYAMTNSSRIGIHFREELRKPLEEMYLQALQEYAKSLLDVSEDHADRFDTFLRWANVSVTPTYNMITCIWPLAQERNLYFNNDLNELSLKIPASLRGARVLHAWILYNLSKRLALIPDSNYFLPPILPHKLKNLVKKLRPAVGAFRRNLIARTRRGNEPALKTSGSWLVLHEMYRKDARYKASMESLIADEAVFPPEIFDLQQIRNTWNEYLLGNTRLDFEIRALLSFGNLNRLVCCDRIEL